MTGSSINPTNRVLERLGLAEWRYEGDVFGKWFLTPAGEAWE